MDQVISKLQQTSSLTTAGIGVNADASPLAYQAPRLVREVPGHVWNGEIGRAKATIRFPDEPYWNGKIIIGATPAVRSEFSLDVILSDIVIQKGYAFAACDKGTPGFTLRDPQRKITEWPEAYRDLTYLTTQVVTEHYGRPASRTYISGVSNGGYITRIMLERYPELFDGGVEWEGVLWHPDVPNMLSYWSTYLNAFPIYRNWRGDRTEQERNKAFQQMVEAGLHPDSEPTWDQYFATYWIVSLWLYGHNMDPTWEPFAADWSMDWLRDPSPLANYPAAERADVVAHYISEIANTGRITKPLLSVAGNWDCLLPYRFNAAAYGRLVRDAGCEGHHRLYEIDRGNHVEGLLKDYLGRQQPVLPYYEAAIEHLEAWVERGVLPPASGLYTDVPSFAGDLDLLSLDRG